MTRRPFLQTLAVTALISAGSALQMGLSLAGLVVVGAMAMYELSSFVGRHTRAHRGAQAPDRRRDTE